ncbi:STAS domain-containing protein [Kitasatospora sp. NPDC004531]
MSWEPRGAPHRPPATRLRIDHRPGPVGTSVVVVTGEADMDTAPALARALRGALDVRPAPRTVVVDCSRLGFCSSSGLNELIRAHRAALAAGVAFRIGAPSRQVVRLLELTETDRVFDIVDRVP